MALLMDFGVMSAPTLGRFKVGDRVVFDPFYLRSNGLTTTAIGTIVGLEYWHKNRPVKVRWDSPESYIKYSYSGDELLLYKTGLDKLEDVL